MSRLRSSVRCSMRLIPGSSAPSFTALRALSIGSRSDTLVSLAGGGFRCIYCRIGIVWDGVENGRECGVADRQAGCGWHKIQVAGGGDGQGLMPRFGGFGFRRPGLRGLRLLMGMAYEELIG